MVLVGCLNPSNGRDYQFNPDPDPNTSATGESPDVWLVANVDGEIRGFSAANPESYDVLLTGADTAVPFARIKTTPDGRYVAYNCAEGENLRIFDTETDADLNAWGSATDEFSFVDDDNLMYSMAGTISNYRCSNEDDVDLVGDHRFGCDHFPVIAPDQSIFVFKNQPPEETPSVAYSEYDPSDPESSENDILFDLDSSTEIGVEDDLYLNWLCSNTDLDTQHLVLKENPEDPERGRGIARGIVTYSFVTGAASGWDVLNETGAHVYYSKLTVSPDERMLVFYGSKGVYVVDLTESSFSGESLTANTLYEHDTFITDFADFTADSGYLVLGTKNWIGIYNAETLEKTDFDSEGVVRPIGSSWPTYENLHGLDAPGGR